MTEGNAHYHELPNVAIEHMVRGLYTMSGEMSDEVTVSCMDQAMKKEVPNWDRPDRDAWLVRKADYLPEVIAEIEIGKRALVAQQG